MGILPEGGKSLCKRSSFNRLPVWFVAACGELKLVGERASERAMSMNVIKRLASRVPVICCEVSSDAKQQDVHSIAGLLIDHTRAAPSSEFNVQLMAERRESTM